KVATDQADALVHAGDAEALGRLFGICIKSAAVVGYLQLQAMTGDDESNLYLSCRAILRGVMDRLLGDAKDTQSYVARQLWRDRRRLEVNLDTAASRQVLAERSQCRGEAKVVELRRMQLIRHPVNFRRDLGKPRLDRRQARR